MNIVTRTLRTAHRSQILDITPLVQEVVTQSHVADGFVLVHVPHTTAAVTINENYDPDVKHDILRKLDELVPQHEPYYRHNEGNSDSHVKTSLVGNSVTVLLESRKIVLGRWQGIHFCEFDGPRDRDLLIKIIPA